jgi:hypothetical protein
MISNSNCNYEGYEEAKSYEILLGLPEGKLVRFENLVRISSK